MYTIKLKEVFYILVFIISFIKSEYKIKSE